ncbi:hypothetical protein C8R45DRAFT_997366 [Mycena sanguinolenta]|nr:hypothetical protein C8R45DRAFT_997366 [Mycena sanguinolenta]
MSYCSVNHLCAICGRATSLWRSRCQNVWYRSSDHMRNDWPHQPVCRTDESRSKFHPRCSSCLPALPTPDTRQWHRKRHRNNDTSRNTTAADTGNPFRKRKRTRKKADRSTKRAKTAGTEFPNIPVTESSLISGQTWNKHCSRFIVVRRPVSLLADNLHPQASCHLHYCFPASTSIS